MKNVTLPVRDVTVFGRTSNSKFEYLVAASKTGVHSLPLL